MKADGRRCNWALNDALRQNVEGGCVALSVGVAGLPVAMIKEVVETVRSFDRFDADNDPHGDHDSARLNVGREHLFWKIEPTIVHFAGPRPTPAMLR